MIVVDSSAVVAILFGEPQAGALLACMAADPDRVMSVVSYVETGTVLAERRVRDRLLAMEELDKFLHEAGIELVAIDASQARLALRARVIYGRGMGHGGVLNFGDAFPYALTQARGARLLFVGDDFGTTDVTPALASDPA